MSTDPMITEELLETLKAKHGPVHMVETSLGSAVFRIPTTEEFQRFQDELANPETKGSAARPLLIACCVYPETKAFLDMIGRRPGLVIPFGNELTEFAGVIKVTDRKSL